VDPPFIQLQKGRDLIASTPMLMNSDGNYEGVVHRIQSCLRVFGKLTEEPITISSAGTAGDSFVFSLPQKYHTLQQYHIHYRGSVTHAIMVNEEQYKELKNVRILK
jgi:hypothetical protein